MSPWVVAALVGVGIAVFQYGGAANRIGAAAVGLGLLRAGSITLVGALLLNAGWGHARALAPWVALDASASMARGDDSAMWVAAKRVVAELHPDSLFLFGDSVRAVAAPTEPADLSSRVAPVVARAVARGHPLVVVTDGELDDPDALRELPTGSRVALLPRSSRPDLAVLSLDLPRAIVIGDTVEARVALLAGGHGSPVGTLTLAVDGRAMSSTRVEPLPPYGERVVIVRGRVQGHVGPVVVRATVIAPRDAERRNDTVAVPVDLSRAAGAVFVSTSPDEDARHALSILRGTLSIPTRGYFRVAPDAWRIDGSLAPLSEAEVRQALRDAPVAILQGDTAIFGPPRDATRGPLALLPHVAGDEGEWYAAGAPPSPLSAGFSAIAWDSLPPIAVSAAAPRGEWKGLTVRRGRDGEQRVAIAGSDAPRRVVVAASGLWRWRFRGGGSSDAFIAVWGSIFDWLAAKRADKRAAVPDEILVRAGDAVRWRRGAVGDSDVVVTLRRRTAFPSAPRGTAGARPPSLVLRFRRGATIVQTPALPAGVYDVTVRGGTAVLVVNSSREWLPRQPRAHSGSVGGAALADTRPRLRTRGWPYAVALVLLCVEWATRRHLAMR